MENILDKKAWLKQLNIETCNILGIELTISNLSAISEILLEKIDDLRGRYICISNVHTTVMAHENMWYRRVQNEALLAVPDGKPLVLACKRNGFRNAQRIAGPDLMPLMIELSQGKGYKHFFYGSTDETLGYLKKNLLKQYPDMKIAGMYAPPYRTLTSEEDSEIIDKINAVNPDYIWVGLGAPKQEIWMNQHMGKVNGLMLGVGAAFDFHAGTVKRAPRWMQEWCLEWFYRLLQDPKRLFKRYLKTNSKFIWLTLLKK